jgi:transcriptional regulator with XRE-family HTH domain
MACIYSKVNTYTFHGVKMVVVTPGTAIQTAFSRALMQLLNKEKWSQRRIARAMGITHPQVRAYLEETQEPGFFKVVALAEEAGVSLDWLAGREPHAPRVEVDGTRYVPAEANGASSGLPGSASQREGSASVAGARADARARGARQGRRVRRPPSA